MIDLSDRIIQTPTVTRAPNGHLRWHWGRRTLQVLCGLALVVLPLTNGLRLDVRRGEFWFAWHKMAAHDVFLWFWVALLGVWGLVAVSFLYGRLWCGWVCPQTLASDFADSVKTRLDRAFRTRPGQPHFRLSRALWTTVVLAMSLGTGILLVCYWLAPATVLRATLRPLADPSAASVIYGLAALLAADMLWVRRKFCANACPYGALLGGLADKNTLVVRYLDERADDCIQCGRCVTDCPMDIDIKQGVMQQACIGCGECVDACNDVLGRRGKAGLIEYRYGTEPERQTRTLTPAQKWGIWDARRVGVLLTLVAIGGGAVWSAWGRTPLRASVLANGAITRDAREVRNTYALTVENGARDAQKAMVTVSGLPPGSRLEPNVPLQIGARETRTWNVTAISPAPAVAPGRTRIRLRVQTRTERTDVSTIFYAPPLREGH